MRYLIVTLFFLISCNEPTKKVVKEKEAIHLDYGIKDSLAPIMLDDIHYYTLNRDACNTFFEKNFGTRAMREESPNPFKFIDFQLVRPQQSTINISASGPFPGIAVGDPKRWERKNITPSKENPPKYGVHWLAFTTKDLEASKNQLLNNGAEIIDDHFQLPHTNAKSILLYGPDYNLLVITEDKNDHAITPYGIDHLLLLVSNLAENQKFFKDVFQAKQLSKGDHYVILEIAKHKFILTEPEGLNIDRKIVDKRDPAVFKPDIDHLGFLFENIMPAYTHAVDKGYEFLSSPIKINYYDKPTLYTFAITFSPDGLQCELYQETGRTASRTTYKEL